MEKFGKILKDINELIMFKHSVFSLPFIFIAMVVANKIDNGYAWFGWELFFLGLLAAISARNFAMGFNRYADRDIDKYNPRTANRPSVDGRVGKTNMLLFIVINALVFIATAYFINDLAFNLSVPILFILAGYSLFKRFSYLAHLVLGISLGLAPIAGVVAVSESIPVWAIMLSLGVTFWVAGFDLLYSLQDMEYDKKNKLHSIPSHFGKDCTFFISKIFHALTVLFWALFVYVAALGIWGWVAILTSALVLWQEHRIVSKDFSKIDKAFFTLNGYLGIMFFILIIFDSLGS